MATIDEQMPPNAPDQARTTKDGWDKIQAAGIAALPVAVGALALALWMGPRASAPSSATPCVSDTDYFERFAPNDDVTIKGGPTITGGPE